MNHIIPSVNKSRNARSTWNFNYNSAASVSVFFRRKTQWLALLILIVCCNRAMATPVDLITQNSSSAFTFTGASYATATPSSSMKITTFAGNGVQNGTIANAGGWDVKITQATSPSTNIELSAVATKAIKAGDLIIATFYYRRVDSASAAEANFSCNFQTINAPNTQSFSLPLRGRAYPANSAPPNDNPPTATDTTWRRVSIPFSACQDYAANAAEFNFIMGGNGLQTLDVADVTLEDYGQCSVFTSSPTPPTNPIDSSSCFTAVTTSGTVTYGTINTGYPISGNSLYSVGTQIQMTTPPLQVWPGPPQAWSLRYDSRPQIHTNVGDTLVAMFWMRSANLPTGTPYAVAGITMTGCAGGSASLMVDPNAPNTVNGWREFIVPLKVVTAENPGYIDFYIDFGFQLQTVQIAGIQLYNLGSALGTGVCTLTNQAFDYPGRALADSWRTTAATNIARYRQGKMTVNVRDGNGNPLSNVTVAASMTAPFFGFGCQTSSTPVIGWNDNNAVDLNGLSLFYQLFDHVEYGCYKWTEWEAETFPSPAQYCAPSYNAEMLDTIHGQGIYDYRGHNLIWPADGLCPPDIAAITTASAMTTQINGHITQMVGDPTVHGYFSTWDAVNEPYDHNDEMQVENGLTRHAANAETQPPGTASATQAQNDATAIKPWLAFIHATDPYPHLFINDWGVENNVSHVDTSHEDYEANLFTNLENANANIDGIGFESHFVDAFTPPLVLDKIFNRFATGLASGHSLIEEVTEFDESESSGMAASFSPDIDLYTDYMNDYLTKVFSTPNFDFFDLWGSGDLYNAYNSGTTQAPVYTYQLRPEGEAWMSLVRNQWWTNTSGVSASGTATLSNCFLGRYCLQATSGSITKLYYTDLLSTAGSTTNVQLSGSAGTTHVWTYAASRRSNAIELPFQVYTDSTAYNGAYVMVPTSGSSLAPVPAGQLPEMRIDTEATGNCTLWLHVSTLNGNQDSFWMQFAGANTGTTVGTADPKAAANGHSPDGPTAANYLYVPLDDNVNWHWIKITVPNLVPAPLVAGKNSLYIVHRETGTKLDEVLITDDPNFTPR